MCAAALLAACDDSESLVTAADGVSAPISRVVVQPAVDTIFVRDTLQAGDAVQLKATVVGFSGTILTNPTVRWTTETGNIVTVDSNGVVRPVAARPGTGTVTAQSGDKKSQATIVIALATTRIAIASSYRSFGGVATPTDTIFLGDAPAASDFVRLRGIAIGAAGDTLTGVAFAWSVAPASATIATVDPVTGIVRPRTQTSFGTATIQVTGAGLTATKQVAIVPAVRALTMRPSVDTIFVLDPIKATDTKQLTATPVLWPSAPPVPVTVSWSSGSPAIAAVDQTGLVTARALGSATINATAAGFTQPASITVLPFVRTVTVTAPAAAARGVVVGDALRFTVSNVGYSGQPVPGISYKWVSSNPIVATIDSTGLAQFLATGTVQFSATGDFVTGTTVANVTVLGNTYQSITTGRDYSCAIAQLGRLDCWGRAGENQLASAGDSTCFDDPIGGTGSSSCTLHPKRAAVPEPFVALSAGDQLACAISETGRAYCWGSTATGQIGNGRTGGASTPTLVTGGLTFILSSPKFTTQFGYTTYTGTISSGGQHACAITTLQYLYCWGSDEFGQLGDSTLAGASSTTPIPAGRVNTTWTAVSAGARHTCAIRTGGQVQCWGANGSGEIGNPAVTNANVVAPTNISLNTAFTQISAGSAFTGGGSHTCGVTTIGSVICWGANEQGQVNGVPTVPGVAAPTVIAGGGYASVSAGYGFTCALRTAGTIDCWGRGDLALPLGVGNASVLPRQVGTAIMIDANGTISAVSPQPTYVSVASGRRHACGLATDGWVYCWGSDVLGALGSRLQAASDLRPVRVARVP